MDAMATLKAHMPKGVLCDALSAAKDALTGLVLCNNGLVLLEDQPIILRRDHSELHGKVKIISGSGAGHEPSFVGFVGPGMLTAAITGNIYSAPPSSVILQAIRELGRGHSEGVLLIVVNYPGSRINFTLAMERAKNEGIYVKMLVLRDDCAYKIANKQKESRGLSGIILIIKIAGAMAEEGKRLDEIYDTCSALAISDITTISVGLMPPQGTNKKSNEVHFGTGIYGEHCIEKFSVSSTKEFVNKMLRVLMESRSDVAAPTCPIVLLLNNMGNCSKLEEYIFTMEVLKQLAEMNFTVARTYCGSFLTSLEIPGFSITMLNVRKPEVLKYLDAPTPVSGWPQHFQCEYVITPDGFSLPDVNLPHSVPSKWNIKEEEDNRDNLCIGPQSSPKGAQLTLQVLGIVTDAICACERQLNLFDYEIGNGETGTVLKSAAVAIKNAIKTERLLADRPHALLQVLSELCENSMGGTHGAFYGIFFAAAAKAFRDKAGDFPIDAFLWLEALREGNKALMNYEYILEGNRLAVVSLDIAANALEQSLKESPDEQVDALKKAAMAAEEHAQTSVSKKPRICSSNDTGCLVMPDPGAHAVGIWLRALYEGCRLQF